MGVAWLDERLKGDESNSGMEQFFDNNCGICANWTVEAKGF